MRNMRGNLQGWKVGDALGSDSGQLIRFTSVDFSHVCADADRGIAARGA